MGIDRIESVTYAVEDLDECVRFFEDFGLALVHRDDRTAEVATLAGQTFRLDTAPDPRLPPPLEEGPTIREVVWGIDTPAELERLVAVVARDRDVRTTADGVHHTHDESGFGLGLALARPAEPDPRRTTPANTWGSVGRWNASVTSVGRVAPIRMCHVALNIRKAGADEAVAFYVERLGFTPTDVVKPMGVFLQCEGDDDQHNLLLCHRPDRAGANHVSFEVPGFDDVIEGGNHMVERGWREARRLGRHTVGSNVFRFLHAPCGGRVEYAADMDRVDASYGTRVHETTPPHHIWTLRTNRDQTDGEARRVRYTRVLVDARAHWARVEGDVVHLLAGSPLEGPAPVERSLPLAGVELLPPVLPFVFYAVGMNYRSHVEHARRLGNAAAVVPERPEVGYRANNALVGHGAAIVVPPDVTGRFEAEGEVVAVLGRRLRRAGRAEAQESVFGWTIGNDVSAREWQHSDRSFWRSKNSDTFKPMGPWIETDVDPMAQTTTVRVNGEQRARFPTGDMVFDPWDYLVEASRYVTLHPGDVLWMGADSACRIGPGDTVDVAITGIGVLSNPVRLETPGPP